MVKKRCSLSRYDKTIKEPPFLGIVIGSFEVNQEFNDDGGSIFADSLRRGCLRLGYVFKFYSLSIDFDYDVVVY